MIKIAIVEDDLIFQNQIHSYIEQFSTDTQQEFSIDLFQDGLDIVDNYTGNWDIIFMDISMQHLDGMSAAKRIREIDSTVIIIFITTMSKYAIKGYEVSALDFLLKPLVYSHFFTKMLKAVHVANKNQNQKYLFFPVETGKEKVSVDNILYIEAKNHHMYIYTQQKTYRARQSLRDMEQQLLDCNFVRCNHSFLINLKHVSGVEKDVVLLGTHRIPISRPKKKDFLLAMSSYFGGGYQ